ncbi:MULTISPECIES: hypothetical protein [unclassified Novosphingobium]|uniref:hypothetical protein n=1 Tax=unclassified Novosphingobium TaxID=2644732 RepID=UPI0025D1A0E5|nr:MULTISPECIES: hypothetical protein [unclassified Novosphingobium]HQV04208.1 hypothetical protein [Novosphingobium sp.]
MTYARSTSKLRGCVVSIAIMAMAIAILWSFAVGYLPMQPFDSGKWKAVKSSSDHSRLRMVEPFLLTHRINGVPKQEIVDLLGPGDETSYFNDWDAVYWLGPERSFFSLDSEWLVIRFGPDGKVIDHRIVRD